MGIPEATTHVSRDRNHLAWDPAIPAVATVRSGEVVELDCLDASFGQLTAESTNETLAGLDFDRVDQVTGPVAVEGAEDPFYKVTRLQAGADRVEFGHPDPGGAVLRRDRCGANHGPALHDPTLRPRRQVGVPED